MEREIHWARDIGQNEAACARDIKKGRFYRTPGAIASYQNGKLLFVSRDFIEAEQALKDSGAAEASDAAVYEIVIETIRGLMKHNKENSS